MEAKQVELDTAKVNFTYTLKSAENERDSLKRELETNVRRGIGRSLCTRPLENRPSTSLPTQLSIFKLFKLDMFSYRKTMERKSRSTILSIICQNMSEIFQPREASSR